MGLKLPLTFSQEKNNGDYAVRDADGEIVMFDTAYYPVAPLYEDAAEIVSAVNSHASLLEEVERLREALQTAKETIRSWHGPNAWEIYDRASPEMQVINEALGGTNA